MCINQLQRFCEADISSVGQTREQRCDIKKKGSYAIFSEKIGGMNFMEKYGTGLKM